MAHQIDLDIIEAADVNALPIEQQAAAFFKGTASIYRLTEDVVCPVVQGQVGKSDQEQAISATFYRMVLLLRGVTALNDPVHFQIVNSVARTVFELVLDLKALAADPTSAGKFHAFARVAKFRKATQLKDFLDANPTVDSSPHQTAIDFANDPVRAQEVEQECVQHWGRTHKGKLRWPEHWSGKQIDVRASDAGIEFAEIYRSQFFLQSYYVHAGPAGIQNLSREALICTFGVSHRLIQQFAATAVEIIADQFHLFATDLDLRDQLRRASAATGFYAVQSVLERQRSDAEKESGD